MSRNYYCLISGMPEIALDQKKLIFQQDELKAYLKESLHPSDFKTIEYLYLEYDNKNILNYINENNSPHETPQEGHMYFNSLAVYSKEDIIKVFKESDEEIAEYIFKFAEKFNSSENKEDLYFWEKQLTQLYYDYVKQSNNTFLNRWFSFEFMLKTVLTAIVSRKYSLDTEKHLIINDDIIRSIAKSNAKDFGLSVEWSLINKIINIYENDNIIKREEDIDMLKWDWLEDATTFEYFSLEVVISIILKLRIVERWINADPEKGKALFIKLLDKVKQSANNF